MLLECCSQERTYLRYYGLLGQRFCLLKREYQDAFDDCFKEQYTTVHRLDTNKLRNTAKFFAHLLFTDALPWTALEAIQLNEKDTTSSSRIFIKILCQELSEQMGIAKLKERLLDDYMQDVFAGLMPKDNLRNTRFAINFFTSIGLGGLTDDLREHLKNAPKLLEHKKPAPSSSSSDSSSDSSKNSGSSGSSSSSDSDSSDTSSSSSSSDEEARDRQRRSPLRPVNMEQMEDTIEKALNERIRRKTSRSRSSSRREMSKRSNSGRHSSTRSRPSSRSRSPGRKHSPDRRQSRRSPPLQRLGSARRDQRATVRRSSRSPPQHRAEDLSALRRQSSRSPPRRRRSRSGTPPGKYSPEPRHSVPSRRSNRSPPHRRRSRSGSSSRQYSPKRKEREDEDHHQSSPRRRRSRSWPWSK